MIERTANLDDRDLVLDLYKHLHESDEAFPELEVLDSAWTQLIDNELTHCFVIEDSGLLVCSCILSLTPNLTRGCRPFGLIENVVTRAEHRRKGLGRRVISNALEFAWEANCYKVMLMTGRKDQAVYDFYASCGFSGDEKRAFIARRKG